MKDILIFMSDQHCGRIAGYMGNSIIRTPNLDRIAAAGTVVENCYTSCPLCIPARASMLSGQLPSKTSVFDLAGFLPSDQATFLHALGALGYETVLCGRMHFEGPDQRHGFSKRIFGDITNLYYGSGNGAMRERGRYAPTLGEGGCLQIIGGGNSPVLEYDRAVIKAALAYLKEPHDRPQCIVVGTYAPHFPYVAPPELYDYYARKVTIPQSAEGCDYSHPAYREKLVDKDPEVIRAARAAYYGLIEFNDQNVGAVFDQWREYLRKAGREGVFCYLSDHGDQCGERGMYAKKVLFDCSIRIPMIFHGDGIPARRLSAPASIMDLGPTLCGLTGAETPPEQDGISLWPAIRSGAENQERVVFSEFIERLSDGEQTAGRMVRCQNHKLITFSGYEEHDLLFDLSADPDELHNLAKEQPGLLNKLRKMALENWNPDQIIARNNIRMAHLELQKKWMQFQEPDESERWKTTPEALTYPEHPVSSKGPMPPHFQKLMRQIEEWENSQG